MNVFASNRIFLLLLVIGGVLGAVVMGSWVAKGNFMNIALILGGIFGALTFLTLGRMYWYVIPLALTAQLPTIPLGGKSLDTGEIAIVLSTAVFIVRLAMKKEELRAFRFTHLPILLFVTWVVIVWILNPVGVSLLGDSTLGGRNYFMVLLGMCAFLVMASQRLTEKDLDRVMFLIIAGAVMNSAFGVFSWFFGGGAAAAGADVAAGFDEYTWHQIIAQPAMVGASLLFARFKPSEVFGFQRPWTCFVYLICLAAALFSGKRMAMFFILLVPFISAFLYREFRYGFVLGILGAAALAILATGHGSLFDLPFSAQRAISWVPGDWDPRLKHLQGGSDTFREDLRIFAIKEIEQHPWIGKGYAMDYNELVASMNMLTFGRSPEDKMVYYAVGRSWHNRWLGYAADFGIPASVLLACIYLVGLFVSYRLVLLLPHPSSSQTFSVYAFMGVCGGIMTSHTSGHAAKDAFNTWWLYGLVFALYAVTTQRNTTISGPQMESDIAPADDQKVLLASK